MRCLGNCLCLCLCVCLCDHCMTPIPSTFSTTVGGQRAILSEVLLADLKGLAKITFLTSSIPPWPTIVFVEKTRWEKIHEKMLSVNGTEPDVRRPWPLVTVATLVRAALLFNFILGRVATTVRLLHCSLTAQLAPANHLIKSWNQKVDKDKEKEKKLNCTTGTSQPSDKSPAYFKSSDGWSHLVMDAVSPKAKKL